MSAVEFYPLRVASVDRLTDDAVAVELTVPPELAERFAFTAGQHVIVRRLIDGHDVRRSYSLCVPAGSGRIRVGIRRIADGLFSTFATGELAAGMTLDVTPPVGDFTVEPEVGSARRYCAIAAGSGITPIISIVETLLAGEPHSEVTLLYGNRRGGSIMFLDELAGLKDRYVDRFVLVHVLSREATDIPLFSGRLDRAKIDELLDALVPTAEIATWFLCGPLGVVEAAQDALAARGVGEDQIRTELFYDQRPPATPRVVAGADGGSLLRFTLAGRTSEIRVNPNGPPLLDYVLSIRHDAPFSCRNGACASCRARVVTGEVTMDHNWALTRAEVAAGQVLTCQSHPVDDLIELTYDI